MIVLHLVRPIFNKSEKRNKEKGTATRKKGTLVNCKKEQEEESESEGGELESEDEGFHSDNLEDGMNTLELSDSEIEKHVNAILHSAKSCPQRDLDWLRDELPLIIRKYGIRSRQSDDGIGS